ncbi:ead/Ea22-like family protein [Klebsiella pneumoniae]|uniref:ead/Ea22-like family protein n=1 Tax=Klebsiella pneumoniae TaxID=573 RepID=UPI0013D25ABE|nr:ead/Ea22-like family protein [Klebsiella pneumoniae]
MTDITELAMSLKAAAVRAQDAIDGFASQHISSTALRLEIEDFESLAHKPANILALVEALEKAQTERDEFRRRFNLERSILEDADKDLKELRQRIAELENYAEAESVGADKTAEDVLYWMNRCKELESRTVKLPKPISVLHRREFTEAHCAIYAYPEAEVNAALDDAGIKVEAE